MSDMTYQWISEVEKEGECFFRPCFTDQGSYIISLIPSEEIPIEFIIFLFDSYAPALLDLASILRVGKEKAPYALALKGERYEKLEGRFFSSEGETYSVDMLESLKQILKNLEAKRQTYERHHMEKELESLKELEEKAVKQIDHLKAVVVSSDKPAKGVLEITKIVRRHPKLNEEDLFRMRTLRLATSLLVQGKISLTDRNEIYHALKDLKSSDSVLSKYGLQR